MKNYSQNQSQHAGKRSVNPDTNIDLKMRGTSINKKQQNRKRNVICSNPSFSKNFTTEVCDIYLVQLLTFD